MFGSGLGEQRIVRLLSGRVTVRGSDVQVVQDQPGDRDLRHTGFGRAGLRMFALLLLGR